MWQQLNTRLSGLTLSVSSIQLCSEPNWWQHWRDYDWHFWSSFFCLILLNTFTLCISFSRIKLKCFDFCYISMGGNWLYQAIRYSSTTFRNEWWAIVAVSKSSACSSYNVMQPSFDCERLIRLFSNPFLLWPDRTFLTAFHLINWHVIGFIREINPLLLVLCYRDA